MRRLQYALRIIAVISSVASADAVRADGFEDVIISSSKGATTSQTTFSKETPRIFIQAHMTDRVKSGSRVVVSWIAVDTAGVAPPNYKIDEVTLDVFIANVIDSSLSKPDNGWPIGDYNVVFSIDGEVLEVADFKIK